MWNIQNTNVNSVKIEFRRCYYFQQSFETEKFIDTDRYLKSNSNPSLTKYSQRYSRIIICDFYMIRYVPEEYLLHKRFVFKGSNFGVISSEQGDFSIRTIYENIHWIYTMVFHYLHSKTCIFFFGYCVPFIVGYYVGKTLGKNIHCLREYIISIILPQHVPPSEIILIEVFEVYSTNVQI